MIKLSFTTFVMMFIAAICSDAQVLLPPGFIEQLETLLPEFSEIIERLKNQQLSLEQALSPLIPAEPTQGMW